MRTIEFYADMKNKLMRQANIEKNPEFKAEQLRAFDFCDRKIAQLTQCSPKPILTKARIGVIVAIALILAVVALSGCVSNTVRGIGSVFEGIGKDTIRAMDGYENNR